MNKIIVAGSGTGVGKTIVSAILTVLLKGDYWKPIQSGDQENSDSSLVKRWIDPQSHDVYPPSYLLKAPLSPHHAARLENIFIDLNSIIPPQTLRPLIIESVGGVFVPLTTKILTIDLFQSWKGQWIVVSKHYLGSINHTLLTIEALKKRHLSILGVIFNGDPNPDSEAAILEISQVPFLGRLCPEKKIDSETIQRYAMQWQSLLFQMIR